MKVAFRKGVTYCVAGELKYRLPQRALTLGERLFVILPRNDPSRDAEKSGLGTKTDRSSRQFYWSGSALRGTHWAIAVGYAERTFFWVALLIVP